MSLILYSGPLSLFTAKVRVALAEKGLAYERIEVGWSLADRYLPHHPEVVARNPKRQVPVLVDGELTVYDSTLVLEYLEEAYPEPPLFPTDVAGRAACRELEQRGDEVIFPAVWDLIEESFYPEPPEGRDPARAEAARASLAEQCAKLDAELGAAGSAFLCGDAPTVGDIGVFTMLNAALTLGYAADPEHRALAAWLGRMRARPSVATELRETGEFLAKVLQPPS